MSIGVGGSAKLVLQDEDMLLYEYFPYNLNEPEYRNSERIYDGIITISKDALVEPEICEVIKKSPSGRKKRVVKRIRRKVDYSLLLCEGKIVVENSRFCWSFLGNGCGYIAMHLIFQILDAYQMQGTIPEKVSYHV